ncbi:MAG: hypothetical protein AB1791_17975 [Chloroflexota bacterium]
MIRHIWTVICSESITDQESNNISLFNILERITLSLSEEPSALPEGIILPISFEVVSYWARENKDRPTRGHARILLVLPSREVGPQFSHDLDLVQYERVRTRTRVNGLSIRGAGLYDFRVQLQVDGEQEWQEVASVPLEILLEPMGSTS